MAPVESMAFLATLLFLVCLQGLLCQELTFDNNIEHDGQGNWTAAGRLRLSRQDMIVFEPKVTIKMTSEMCSLNLRSCLSQGETPPTHKACYCIQDSDDDYHVFVNSHNDLPLKDLTTVEATVPSRYYFSPLALTATIGDLPKPGDKDELPDACHNRVKELEKKLDDMTAKMEKKLDEMAIINERKSEERTNSLEEKISTMLERKLKEMSTNMDQKANEMSTKMDKMDQKANEMSTKMDNMGQKANEMSTKMDKMDKKANEMSTTFDKISIKIETSAEEMSSKKDENLDEMIRKMDAQFDKISTKMENTFEAISSKIEKKSDEVPEQVEKLYTEITTNIEKKANEIEKNIDGMSADITMLTKTVAELTNTSRKTDDLHSTLVLNTCADVISSNPRPVVTLSNGLTVVCDTETDDGGWYVIQRRASPEVDFYRNWDDYKKGFGDMRGNFWFGLENTHRLTIQGRYELRVDFTFNQTDYYAHYNNFTILDEKEKYKLLVSGYSGNAGDSLTFHNKMSFTTKDKDNDIEQGNCAVMYRGAWWYARCHKSNLNGLWGNTTYGKGVVWYHTTGHHASASFTEMKIRPVTS